MPRKQRPYFTYLAFALAMLGAVYLEASGNLGRRDGAVSLILCGPIAVLGFGIDWARLARPGWLVGSAMFGVGFGNLALILYGLSHDWLNIVLGTAGAAALLALVVWSIATWPRRIFEATYLGTQGGMLIFAEGEECWVLRADVPHDLALGERYAFRGSLDEPEFEGEGPFRRRSRISGQIREIAPSRSALRERRLGKARSFVRVMGVSAATVCGALVLHNL